MVNSLSKKLVLGFLSIMILLVFVGGMGFYSVTKMNNRYSYLLDDKVKKVNLVNELISVQKDISADLHSYLLLRNNMYKERMVTDNEKFIKISKELKTIFKQDQNLHIVEKLLEGNLHYDGFAQKVIDSFIKMEQEQVEKNARLANSEFVVFLKNAEQLKENQNLEMSITRDDLNSLVRKTNIVIISLSIIALIASGLIAYFISRSITRPVQMMTDALQLVADGNLQIDKLHIKSRDEIGTMASAFNKMTDDLRFIVSRMSESAVQLAAQSEELSASSEESTASAQMVASVAEEHLKGSEGQLEIVGQTVSSMEKMTSGILQISVSNDTMLLAVQSVGSLVKQGSLAFDNVSIQMNEIRSSIQETATIMDTLEQSSINIQKITAIITAISNQTNLLALNAAIEAARAGQHGKGFAVVAEEVRKLAEQSKESASEIEDMIKFIQSDSARAANSIKIGSDKANQGLTTLETSLRIFEHIEIAAHDASESVHTVFTAVEEIQTMTDEVISGSLQMKELAETAAASAQDASAATEEQLATIEEISASTQSLASLAEDLQLEVSKFIV
ncbi:methyl-accepting chemotaxis protein [Sporosarcina limicola]|uniref:Methyl-accepting chemotaxis protein n=1 Tax=Sporosarcina limicola TaxID=34101 RepID=A0A927MN69_9BACL|nr:HAMP domain-containing methyl-accepting chemotaxis protein [Sporosarcina limicola]MBE1556207.1 methyl-accepting chemotaxis protein [Sporosarcina limicola]